MANVFANACREYNGFQAKKNSSVFLSQTNLIRTKDHTTVAKAYR